MLFAVALALVMGGGAKAQSTSGDTLLSKGWDVRLGFFIPDRGNAKAAEGDVWFTAGIERAFYQHGRHTVGLSVDYYGSGKVYNVPILVNVHGESKRFRYGAGVGVSMGHDLTRGTNGFAYQLGIGYVLTQGPSPIVFDIRYRGVGNAGELNGVSFTLGGHF
jgi:hypothetical protein